MNKILLITLMMITTAASFAQERYRSQQALEPQKSEYESSLFRSMDGLYFNIENDNTATGQLNILNWLQGRVAGLQVYTVRGNRIPFMRNYPATIYVDEIRTDASFLSMLSMSDIALIKVMRAPGIMTGRGGAIAIYTKRGEGEDEEDTEGK